MMYVWTLIRYSFIFHISFATVTLKFMSQKVHYEDAADECEFDGGLLLMKNEEAFSQILTETSIPFNQEFWVADRLYTEWILPVDCRLKSSLTLSQNSMNTTKLFDCYHNCLDYDYFAIKLNYCWCLDQEPKAPSQPSDSQLSECTSVCSDVGLCGSSSISGAAFVNIYEKWHAYASNIHINAPNAVDENSYVECMTSRCYVNEHVAVNCNYDSIQRFGFCASGKETSNQASYTSSLLYCAQQTDSYFPGFCENSTYRMVWTGPMRNTIAPQGGMVPGLSIARGAKCTKFPGAVASYNCIPTTEDTLLPFVCKKGHQQQFSTTEPPPPPTTTKKSGGGNNTTGIVVGCIAGVVVFCGILVIIVFVKRRKSQSNNNSEITQKPKEQQTVKSVYELPKSKSETYDHVYAETSDVYHPYLEIKDGTNSITSGEYLRNRVNQENGISHHNYTQQNGTNSTGMLAVDSEYLEPARTPNFGRKLPDIPSHENL